MHLTKWYLDCTGDDGEALILYWAHLRYRRLQVRYAAMLWSRPGAQPIHRWRLRAGAPPQYDHARQQCIWACPALGINGTWSGKAPAATRTLLATEAGDLTWHCLLPGAHVSIALPGGKRLEGHGYVERLEMSVPPWRLPIEDLRWGRFVADDLSVVWIEWIGLSPRRLALLNGIESPVEHIDESGVYLEDGRRLLLRPERTLRDGTLGGTVLSAAPAVVRLAPRGLLGVQETKWLSWGSWQSPSPSSPHPTREAWAIHELVRFGPARG
jgi:hypothetical protein